MMASKKSWAAVFIILQIIIPCYYSTTGTEDRFLVPHNSQILHNEMKSTCIHWTPWLSANIPNRDGDYETLSAPDDMGVPGTINQLDLHEYGKVCTLPVSVQCRVRPENISWTETYDELLIPCRREHGLVCRTRDQPYDRSCRDYEVRFLCWNECQYLVWSDWMDNDNPDGYGDTEILGDTIARDQWPCSGGEMPMDVECETVTGIPIHQSKKRGLKCSSLGFSCANSMQPAGSSCRCDDFHVRFLCPKQQYFPEGYRRAPEFNENQ